METQRWNQKRASRQLQMKVEDFRSLLADFRTLLTKVGLLDSTREDLYSTAYQAKVQMACEELKTKRKDVFQNINTGTNVEEVLTWMVKDCRRRHCRPKTRKPSHRRCEVMPFAQISFYMVRSSACMWDQAAIMFLPEEICVADDQKLDEDARLDEVSFESLQWKLKQEFAFDPMTERVMYTYQGCNVCVMSDSSLRAALTEMMNLKVKKFRFKIWKNSDMAESSSD